MDRKEVSDALAKLVELLKNTKDTHQDVSQYQILGTQVVDIKKSFDKGGSIKTVDKRLPQRVKEFKEVMAKGQQTIAPNVNKEIDACLAKVKPESFEQKFDAAKKNAQSNHEKAPAPAPSESTKRQNPGKGL